jgi:hypothetical protein
MFFAVCKWIKNNFGGQYKISYRNIIKMFPHPKSVEREIIDEISTLYERINTVMLDNAVKDTNMHIESNQLAIQYLRYRDAEVTSNDEI